MGVNMQTVSNDFIPEGTWFYKSTIGTYSFLYPAKDAMKAETDINIVNIQSHWQPQRGLVAVQTTLGVIWCEKSAIVKAK